VIVGYYWESKRVDYFWRGLVCSLLFSPFIGVVLGFSFDRISFGSSKQIPSPLNNLMLAAVNQKPEIIMNLVSAGERVNQRTLSKRTPLMIAAESNRYSQVCEYLIKAGAKVNDCDKQGVTPLMWAAKENDYEEVCRVLIKQGAEVNARDKQGITPLMFAAYSNPNPKVIEVLLEAGANPKILDNEGKSVFDYAHKLPNQVFLDSEVYVRLRRVTIITPSK